jgi:D-alanyl-lipoteichoic acid acyltransferase DltB (MBOAT superfamily)
MLFSSTVFLLFFLPIVLLGFHLVGRAGPRAAIGWLTLASFAFYGYWRLESVVFLASSIVINFCFARLIVISAPKARIQSAALLIAVASNLGALGFYKYLFTLLTYLHSLGAGPVPAWANAALPLGISFFTFTQIGYLVDLKQGEAKPQSLLNYALFVTFFPHLIAGPIIHHREIMPQFEGLKRYVLRADDFAVGLSWFVLGLAKKTLIADHLAGIAGRVMTSGGAPGTGEAWCGALAYSLQLYFDFSGYSDMAIGLARMFSIRFPLNFNSPYKASSIIDYWQRWHMTLTRYITLYLYNPIALWITRKRAAAGKKTSSKARATAGGFIEMVALPTVITMFFAGVWHGAGWQFLIFGLLHGFYITLNHAWRIFGPKKEVGSGLRTLKHALSVIVTYLAVLVGQVFFGAPSVRGAVSILRAMVGYPVPGSPVLATTAALPLKAAVIAGLFVLVWTAPNTQQIIGRFADIERLEVPRSYRWWSWRANWNWALALATLFVLAVFWQVGEVQFLYFQF